MEDTARSLRELAEANRELVEKLAEVKDEIIKDREERTRKAEIRARNLFEMDIEFIMATKHWSRDKTIEKLQKHKYDVARVIKGNLGMIFNDNWLQQILCYYEYKRNRQRIERW